MRVLRVVYSSLTGFCVEIALFAVVFELREGPVSQAYERFFDKGVVNERFVIMAERVHL